jgi:peptide/nickel transport system permease protein
MHVAFLITKTIFVETVFSYPGLGRLLFQAIQARDYPVLQGVFLVMTIAVLGANFLVDISYRFLDPRIDRLR